MTTPMNDAAGPPIMVFAHVHYPEIWQEMCVLLSARLTVPFHLVVTSSHPAANIALPATPSLLSARIVPVENRGRDIRPFLLAMAGAMDFEIGLKLHTKKSPQRENGAAWRAAVLDSLLPPGGGAAAIVARLRGDPRVGIVAPGGFCLGVKIWLLQNVPGMGRAAASLGIALAERDYEDAFFAAGSMFWFRRAALVELADDRLIELFEAEEGQLDGTVAHAMERLFAVHARRRGFLSLAVPALLASRPDMSGAALLNLARQYADLPSPFFVVPEPPPPPPPPPPRLYRLVSPVYRLLPERLRIALRRAGLGGG